jgi:uncharacterized protein (TIGR02996 family)
MGERESLLAAILRNPEDDLPRLIYADWLEERGEEAYATFIRVQIHLARGQGSAAERRNWERLQRELLQQYEEEWVQPLRAILNLPAGEWGGWVFRRGFAEYFHLPAAILLRHGAALAAQTPLRAIYVHPCSSPEFAQLVQQPWFRQIVEVYAPQTLLSLSAVIALLESRSAEPLRRLVVGGASGDVDDYWLHACRERFGVQLHRVIPQLPPARSRFYAA